MNKPAYFKQFGAEDYNIFVVKDKSYVMSRFTDDPEGVYYMLFEHVESQDRRQLLHVGQYSRDCFGRCFRRWIYR